MSTTFLAVNTRLKVEASINAANISGLGGVVWPRLAFQVLLNISDEIGLPSQDKIQSWSFGILTGELLIGYEKIADIKTYSLNRVRYCREIHPTEIYLNIEIPLDARRIEWLEQQRAGKSFEAKLRIDSQVQLFGNNSHTPGFSCGVLGVENIHGEIPFVVPDTHWRENVLPGLGYGKVIVVELPAVSLEMCAALEHPFKSLQKAQKQFSLGMYDDAAGSCRIALDQFFEPVDKGDGSGKTIPKLKIEWEMRLGAATHQWLNSAFGIIKGAANKAHHSPNSHFDRLGAQMLIMTTTALVSYMAQQLSDEAQP